MKSIPTNSNQLLRLFLITTALSVFLLILLGSILRSNNPGASCPDWPTCFGIWLPPVGTPVGIDYAHRAATALTTALFIFSSILVYKFQRQQKWIIYPLLLGLSLLLFQIFLGAWISQNLTTSIRPWTSSLHLVLSLVLQACTVISTITAFSFPMDRSSATRITFRTPYSRLSLSVLISIFLLLVSGAIVTASGAGESCSSWPLCGPGMLLSDPAVLISLSHRLIVSVTAILILFLVFFSWKSQRSQTPVLVSSTTVGILFFAQALLGSRLVVGFPNHLVIIHQATAVSLWIAMLVQIAAVGLSARDVHSETIEATSFKPHPGLLLDFLLLTKPIVVILLLVTTYAGMVIGAKAWPSLPLTFITLIGGFMAAGGSGAINQYIDRFDDGKMQRTQKRPIPSGRLTPGEGLAFGVAMALASFYLMVAWVNLLAALLTLAGVIYYVLVYSIFLKKTTVQNIVIGGGAGAIPPLVGWAAATGSLNIPSLFLFAVVFMWTPPHFWALALVRRKDYARAGVPMLPVIRGEKVTRWQIFLYTLELVGLTLFLPLFGLGGSIYLILAVMLGGWLLMTAWRVWRQGGNKLAWKMYRYSSMYLAFLFVALMVDALI